MFDETSWKKFSKEEKIKKIEEILDKEIRPFMVMDKGGVTVEDVKEDNKVIITYQGACVGCIAATGATLSAIQEVLRKNLHPSIVVIPNK